MGYRVVQSLAAEESVFGWGLCVCMCVCCVCVRACVQGHCDIHPKR